MQPYKEWRSIKQIKFELVAQGRTSFKPEVYTLLVIELSLDFRQTFRSDVGIIGVKLFRKEEHFGEPTI